MACSEGLDLLNRSALQLLLWQPLQEFALV